MKYQDYYKALDLQRGATAEDIKRAYRTLARQYHPDVNKDPSAQERFKAITEAYEVLKDPEKRKLYDQLGENWRSGQDFRPPPGWSVNVGNQRSSDSPDEAFPGFSDFFAQIFGAAGPTGEGGFNTQSARSARSRAHTASPFGRAARAQPTPRRGRDIESTLDISLAEAHRGATKSIAISLPGGSTKNIDIRIPPATTDGSTIRLRGQGSPSQTTPGEPGDIRLRIRITPDPRFTLDGKDLHHRITIPVHDAVLGAKVRVPTIDGQHITLTIPPGTQPNAKLRLRGQGLGTKTENNTTEPGDLYVIIDINIPKSITDQQRTLYEQLAQAANNQQTTA